MIGLSILIPVYNDDCVAQVKELHSQCMAINKREMNWEIVVVDDGSPQPDVNSSIASIDHCRFIKRDRNYGRSATRNYLAHVARYDTLLYIDSGLWPNPQFVDKYVDNIGKAPVVCGNIAVSPDCIDMTNLRCRNELHAQKRFTAAKHAMEPYKNFHSGNFMIDRNVILENPFSEDIVTYGYEDTLFGKQLKDRHIDILHIDNPILFIRFESNRRYIEKTQEGIDTLFAYKNELTGYSPLLDLAIRLRSLHLLWLPYIIGKCFGHSMVDNLIGDNPNLRVFSIYRLCLLAEKYHSS